MRADNALYSRMTGRLDGLPGHVPDPVMDSQRSAGAAVAGRLTSMIQGAGEVGY
jgi:hypothetical protein